MMHTAKIYTTHVNRATCRRTTELTTRTDNIKAFRHIYRQAAEIRRASILNAPSLQHVVYSRPHLALISSRALPSALQHTELSGRTTFDTGEYAARTEYNNRRLVAMMSTFTGY